jgi:hypothetical protein
MRRSPQVLPLRWPSIVWIGVLLGALGVLGYALHEAAHPTHRHVIDGEIVAHDHLDTGPHEHAPENPRDGEPAQRSPTEDQVYQGPTTMPMVDDADGGVAIAAPSFLSCAAAVDAPGARPAPETRNPPVRGPPTCTRVVIS